MLKPSHMSFVKVGFQEEVGYGLGFSKWLVAWDLAQLGQVMAKAARRGSTCSMRVNFVTESGG